MRPGGLNPDNARVMELQCEIRETFEEVVLRAGEQGLFTEGENDYIAAAEL